MPERSVRKSERTMSDRPVQPVEEVARMQEQMGNMSRKMEKPREKKKKKKKCEPFQTPPWPSPGPALFPVDGSPYAAALYVLVIVFNFIILCHFY